MRKVDAALEQRKPRLPASQERAARELVCLALILAVTALVCRIVSIW